MAKGKLCYCCCAPKVVCTSKRCSNETRVPETLKCQGCKPWATSKGLAPFNILFCKKKDHMNLRAPFDEMKADMENYMGKF